MRAPAVPPRAALRRGGFTLLEVLVVVFIVGILASLASLSISGRALDDVMQEEARRMEQIFRLASEESALNGIELGFVRTEGGYRFLALAPDGAWVPYGDESPLRPRQLPDPLTLKVRVGDLALPQTDPEKPAPHILFLSSGELTPFDITIVAPETAVRYRISGEITGAMALTRLTES